MVIFEIINETEEKFEYSIEIKKVIEKTLKKEKIKNAIFNIIIVDNKKIREINKEYRKKDSVTDVISFALNDSKDDFDEMLGDIYISIERAKEQAAEYGHSILREMAFLSVHGLLHLLGYDHQTEDEEKIMMEKTEVILDEEKIRR